jgi:hypothetical protein
MSIGLLDHQPRATYHATRPTIIVTHSALSSHTLEDLPEMKAVDRERYGQGREPRSTKNAPQEESPVVEPLFLFYAEHKDRHDERFHLTETETSQATVQRFVILQKPFNPGIELIRRVDRPDDLLITFDQRRILHLGNEIDRKVGIITGHFSQQPVFPTQALIELCTAYCIEQSNHCRDNSTVLDEPDLSFEYGERIMVKSYDEAALHLQAELLYLSNALNQVTVLVLDLTAFGQALLIRRLYPNEHGIKTSLNH